MRPPVEKIMQVGSDRIQQPCLKTVRLTLLTIEFPLGLSLTGPGRMVWISIDP